MSFVERIKAELLKRAEELKYREYLLNIHDDTKDGIMNSHAYYRMRHFIDMDARPLFEAARQEAEEAGLDVKSLLKSIEKPAQQRAWLELAKQNIHIRDR